MRGHRARLDRLEQGLEVRVKQIQDAMFALYQRGVMREQVDALFAALRAGDGAAVERIFMQDIVAQSPEWRQLWVAYDAIDTALNACWRIRHGTA